MTLNSNSLNIPKELLKFQLEKQFRRLKQNLINSNDFDFDNYGDEEEEEEDKFQLYQRILSWFIMGRLAKIEYDWILSEILNTPESIELHNKVIELLRAIHCDFGSNSLEESNGSNNIKNSFLNAFDFELNLLPPDEFKDVLVVTEPEPEQVILDENDGEPIPLNAITTVLNAKIKSFDTYSSSLTPSEEALISEALRNPIHTIASMERDAMIQNGFEIFTDRLCTEIFSLPDQNVMKQRFLRIGSTIATDNINVPDLIPILACKALEDYMKNILENVATMKFGRQTLLRPPISYIFPNSTDPELETDNKDYLMAKEESEVTLKDVSLLFKLKPWLLADLESDLIEDIL